jgi:hypothetical protein
VGNQSAVSEASRFPDETSLGKAAYSLSVAFSQILQAKSFYEKELGDNRDIKSENFGVTEDDFRKKINSK